MTDPIFDFDNMREDHKQNDVIAKMRPTILQIGYACDLDAFCLLNRSGEIYSHEEFEKFVAEMEEFYRLANEQDIIDTNDFERKERKGNLQMPSPEKAPVAKYVYLISKGNGHFKIGITSNPKSRLSQIRTVEPNVEILHNFFADDAIGAEAALHHAFKEKNVGGEWFALSGKDIFEISAIEEYKNSKFIGSGYE